MAIDKMAIEKSKTEKYPYFYIFYVQVPKYDQ